LFDGLSDECLAPDDIEVLAVKLEVIPKIFSKHFDLGVILSAHNRVYIQTKAVPVFVF